MTSAPLNEEALEHAIIKYAESSERTDWAELGHFLKEDYRGQVREIVSAYLSAVPADTVNSVEELEALPVGSIGRSKHDLVAVKSVNGWLVAGYSTEFRIINLPFSILQRPEVTDA